jgi:UDP-N-acetylmuramoyl-L-alanyl-D-glutamate--2,6-diaminopimelate ligase
MPKRHTLVRSPHDLGLTTTVPAFAQLTPSSPRGATLAEVRSDGLVLDGDASTRVLSVAVDHRYAQAGALFAALPGGSEHGAEHSVQAAAAGAVAILTDPAGVYAARSAGLPLLIAAEPRAVLGDIAATVYGTDRHTPVLFGVTGTNGKTTTVHVLDALLTQLGIRSGRSSTTDRKSGDTIVDSRLTTPESPELHALLGRMNEDGVSAAALEVSAQALSRHRVDGLRFDVAGFTNLGHDHRDEYPTDAEYLAAKAALFQPTHSRRGVVLLDTPAGYRIRDRAGVPVTTVSTSDRADADWTARVVVATASSTAFTLDGPDGRHLSSVIPLLGRHMVADSALAIVMLVESGLDFDTIARTIADGIEVVVPGRTDLVSGPLGPRVYLDFSHTPDSIVTTLSALRVVAEGKVIVVVGADGEKDPTKRVPMGRASAEGANIVIVTDHHSRFEDPAVIRRALLDGAESHPGRGAVFEIPEPRLAIRAALRMADANDTILWVGPGQTDYRIVRGRDLPYSPRADARAALAEAGWAS